MKNRFDFEQEFLSCWNITSDLRILLEECESLEDSKVSDYISNIILGLESVYEMRFNKAWETFETIVRNNELDNYGV